MSAVKSPGAATPGQKTSSPTHNHVGTGEDMSTTIVPFKFGAHEVRAQMDHNEEPWFVASDIARVLEYRKASDMLRILDHDEKGAHLVRTPGGEQELATITEPGLYRVINSRKAGCVKDDAKRDGIKRFQRWVSHDVLPSIRRTGGYQVEPVPQPERPLLPQSYAEALRELAATVEAKQRAEEVAESKQRALDVHEGATGSHSVRDAVKILAQDHGIHIKEMDLRTRLREWRWTFRSKGYDQPYATHSTGSGTGRLCLKPQTRKKDGRRVVAAPQLRVTQKGITDLARILGAGTQQVAIIEGGVA